MSETTGPSATTGTTGFEIVHEAYSFACMRCAHCWEQSYDIEHHIDAQGRTVVAYSIEGRAVPSPLTRPTCEYCGGHLVRIMQAGTVSSLAARTGRWQRESTGRPGAGNDGNGGNGGKHGDGAKQETKGAEGTDEAGETGQAAGGGHHWHLPALLRHLHPHRRGPAA